jgi:regulator of cell morphogenesis and NO signaling
MSHEITQQATALIEQIQTRFHEGHRRALPGLLAKAAAVEARGLDTGLVETLRAIGTELEQHMFKEEMRLFPMMEQGGNTLIARLIDDMHREHRQHEDAVEDLLRLRAALPSDAAHAAADFDAALARLLADLSAHVRAEDDDLFPRFLPTAAAR